ncbi:MAG: HIT family protein [Gammaproteobacteria bacterium]|nr:MAG: HIT family protein [Gammaproteobacteria bacterium]
MFTLDPRLEQDTIHLGEFPLCRVLLMNDARYPWIILVPRQTGLTEVFQLTEADQQQLMRESSFVAEKLNELVQADKINTAALGNVVSQLHIHHVARYYQDESWPAPVWGKGTAVVYTEDEANAVMQQLTRAFTDMLK